MSQAISSKITPTLRKLSFEFLTFSSFIIMALLFTTLYKNSDIDNIGIEKYLFALNNPRKIPYSKNKYEVIIERAEDNIVIGLGENGKPAFLEAGEAISAYNVMKRDAFNVILSEKISLKRETPDPRDPLCRGIVYDEDLPSASVIIVMHNEPWSTLLRTVHSVLRQSPPHFLQEVIVVDDASTREELHGRLYYYFNTRFPKKVELLRLTNRSGLIRARLAGAREAKGDVLIFLDAHCEVTHTWMEPLLQRIKESRTTVALPIIDVIDAQTLQYLATENSESFFFAGGFTWDGQFIWINVPWNERKNNNKIFPSKSPTMAGGILSIERNFFWEIGAYDPGMDIWGGENLEMSFRVWQCGGSLETIPCSRVGHIFRHFHPYSFPEGRDTLAYNTARMAEVWMDEYKRLFYYHHPDLLVADIGDITDRLEFRRKKNCKNFKWYIDNIYPQKFIIDENVQAYGRVSNDYLCLDNLQREKDDKEYYLGLYGCHPKPKVTQVFSLSNNGELRRETMCAGVRSTHTVHPLKVTMQICHGQKGNQFWELYKDGRIVHKQTKLCLDTAGLGFFSDVELNICSLANSQIWKWDNYII